ncbi:MAG: hypothetical protein KC478_16830 [Bacteriovoracaceae bacterium]|nr:hypothetical protein [Bacteriovoracaceae bacterium]
MIRFASYILLVSLIFVPKSYASKWYNDSYALFNYSYLDLLIPGKWGISAGKEFEQGKRWELEYLKSTLGMPFVMEDIGSMADTRITLMRRNQIWFDSFNIAYGLTYFDFSIFIGDELLDTISSGDAPSADVVDVRSLGTYISFGNRWELGESFVFGVDWFAWSQPWIKLKQESDYFKVAQGQKDREIVRDALDVVRAFPRITLLKLQLGMRF